MSGLELEAFWAQGLRAGYLTERRGAARDRAAGGDAAVSAPLSSADRGLLQ